jgi:hypothetical protein
MPDLKPSNLSTHRTAPALNDQPSPAEARAMSQIHEQTRGQRRPFTSEE